MKRKLNENDVPESFEERAEASDAGFNSLGLDPRLLQAIAKQDFSAPTPIQLKAIPLALTGKNILGMNFRRLVNLIADLSSSISDWIWQDLSLRASHSTFDPI